jgi:hypothetical protein
MAHLYSLTPTDGPQEVAIQQNNKQRDDVVEILNTDTYQLKLHPKQTKLRTKSSRKSPQWDIFDIKTFIFDPISAF